MQLEPVEAAAETSGAGSGAKIVLVQAKKGEHQEGARVGSNGSVFSFENDVAGEHVVENSSLTVVSFVVLGQKVQDKAEHFDVSENLVTDLFENNFDSKVSLATGCACTEVASSSIGVPTNSWRTRARELPRQRGLNST